jgi:hypothetical protein
MIALVLLYFAGKAFYDLAGKHGKHQWGFAILGVASYYGGVLLGGVILGIVLEIYSPGYVETANETMLSIMMIPIGVLTCYLTYILLKKNWSKPKEVTRVTLDADMMNYKKDER